MSIYWMIMGSPTKRVTQKITIFSSSAPGFCRQPGRSSGDEQCGNPRRLVSTLDLTGSTEGRARKVVGGSCWAPEFVEKHSWWCWGRKMKTRWFFWLEKVWKIYESNGFWVVGTNKICCLKMLAQILFWGRWGQGLTDISADKFEVSSTCSNIHSEKLKWWRKKLWLGCGDIGGAKELPNHRVECIWNDARLGSFTPKLAAVLLEEKVSKVEGKPVEVRFRSCSRLNGKPPLRCMMMRSSMDINCIRPFKPRLGHTVNGLAGLNPHGASEYGLLLPGTTKLGSLAALLQRVWLPPTCWSQLILLFSHRILYFPDLEADVPPRTSYESNAAGVRTTNWMMEEEEEEVDGRMMDSLDQVLSEGRFLGLVTTRSVDRIRFRNWSAESSSRQWHWFWQSCWTFAQVCGSWSLYE